VQVLVPAEVHPLEGVRHTGCCVLVEGLLKASPAGASGQLVELHATSVLHTGPCDASIYPIAKKKITLEYLREKIHLRTRTNTIAAVARIRNCLAFATHEFFQQAGFLYVHTPLITTSDCEGAGEMFQVTTLLAGADAAAAAAAAPGGAGGAVDLEALKAAASAAGSAVKAAKEAAKAEGADPAALPAALAALAAAKGAVAAAEEAARSVGGLPRTAAGGVDYAKDFFGQKAFLTVSGQLQGEIYACALSSVYTFGPTFRAENSHTTRHLAEFWMIEPELAFATLADDMNCAEDYVRFCCKALLARCPEDLELMAKMCARPAAGLRGCMLRNAGCC
jgi:asparaginyl-tRNA synthetase